MQDMSRETRDTPAGPADAVSFTERLLASENFMGLYREGMALVEATAEYLDGAGRAESKNLDRALALAYASESMRLTTRLMQLTSWLLLQRAVNEGELSRDEAEREHRRVVVATQDSTVAVELFIRLPEKLRELIDRSLSLQSRIRMIDAEINRPAPAEAKANPVANQLGMLAAAFQRR